MLTIYCSGDQIERNWAGHVPHVEERRDVYSILEVNLRERDHLGDADIDGSIILRWIFRKWDVGGTNWIKFLFL
jgi:hypothetical protein